jgi:hypothetical protein
VNKQVAASSPYTCSDSIALSTPHPMVPIRVNDASSQAYSSLARQDKEERTREMMFAPAAALADIGAQYRSPTGKREGGWRHDTHGALTLRRRLELFRPESRLSRCLFL